MRISDLFETITESLQKAGCESPAFDACCLLEDFASLPHGVDPRFCDLIVEEDVLQTVFDATRRRAEGEPLQYVLGEWEFLSLSLKVGPGVLIPRPDTELLCETVAEKIGDVSSICRVLDLCAGSGCVGMGIASLLENVNVTAVELSDDALSYLRHNVARYPMYSVDIVKDDVLSPSKSYSMFDAIVSNPPYIPTADLEGLMREVQHEPRMALDGAEDGLCFYRAIIQNWYPLLSEGGYLAVEVGIGQAQAVAELFRQTFLEEIEVFKDFGGIERVVCGRRKKSQ